MKNKSINEFRMDVGSDGSYHLGKHNKFRTSPIDADSTFSRGMQQSIPTDYFDYLEEDSEEDFYLFEADEVNQDIEGAKSNRAGTLALIGRVFRNKGTTKAAAEKTAKEAVKVLKSADSTFLSKIPGLAKIGASAVPVLDIGIATLTIVSALNQINDFNRKFNKKLGLVPGSELPNYLIDASDREFEDLIEYIQQAFLRDDKLKDSLRDDFNSILQTFKDLLIVVCVALTPYITAAGGTAALPIIGTAIAYIGTKAAGLTSALIIHSIPAERILFELSSELMSGLSRMFKVFESHEDFSEGVGNIKRDSLGYCFISNFIQSMSRMGKIYNALYVNEATSLDKAISLTASEVNKMSEHNKNKYMLVINEVKAIDEFQNYSAEINALDRKLTRQASKLVQNEDGDKIEEFSGVGALGGVPVTPLGTDATGKRVSRNKHKKRQKFNREKSFPYRG